MDPPGRTPVRRGSGDSIVFGPLPRLHRLAVVAGALVLSIATAVWLAAVLDLALPLGGLLVGSAVGLWIAWLVVHDSHDGPRPARLHRRH